MATSGASNGNRSNVGHILEIARPLVVVAIRGSLTTEDFFVDANTQFGFTPSFVTKKDEVLGNLIDKHEGPGRSNYPDHRAQPWGGCGEFADRISLKRVSQLNRRTKRRQYHKNSHGNRRNNQCIGQQETRHLGAAVANSLAAHLREHIENPAAIPQRSRSDPAALPQRSRSAPAALPQRSRSAPRKKSLTNPRPCIIICGHPHL